MNRVGHRFAWLAPFVLVSGCAGLMMDVDDRPGSDSAVVLAAGSSVRVAAPTMTDEVRGALPEGYRNGRLESLLQADLVRALTERGVSASAGDDGDSVLKVRVTDFSSGSGAARMFLSGSGIGDSKLNGTAILITPSGRRELEVRKVGSQSGAMETGSQVAENIDYFTSALAGTIVQ